MGLNPNGENRIRYYVGEDDSMSKEKVNQCCSTCEFNAGIVCMGYGKRIDNEEYTYGMPIKDAEKMFPHGCEDWGVSLSAFIDKEDNK